MQIFIINLKKRPDRKAFMQKQLDELCLEGTFIEAYDGLVQGMPPLTQYNPALALKANGKALAPGELGCALSHRSAYERIVKEGLSCAVILEDDVVLTPQFGHMIRDEAFLASRPWSWLQIDYPAVGTAFLAGWLRSSQIEIMRKPSFVFYAALKFPYLLLLSLYEGLRESIGNKESPRIVYFARPLYFASAYIVTYAAAATILKQSTPILFPADRLPNQARLLSGFRLRAVVPHLVVQAREQFPSDIGY